MVLVSLKETLQEGIREGGLIYAVGALILDGAIVCGRVYPLQVETTPNVNILDLHVHQDALIYSMLQESGGVVQSGVRYANRTVMETDLAPRNIIAPAANSLFRLYGVPGDRRFYAVNAHSANANMPARFYKSETDTGTAAVFPANHGTIHAMYVFRNVGYASTSGYPLLKSEFGNPANFNHVDSIFDFGIPEQLALCDGFEPYALTSAGAFWVNWGAKSYARYMGHFPTANPLAGLTLYGLWQQKYAAAKNAAFFLAANGYGVFMENREPVLTRNPIVPLMNRWAKEIGFSTLSRIYINAHFPYWVVVVTADPVAWESGNYSPLAYSLEASEVETPYRAVLIAGDLTGVRTIMPIQPPTGPPYVFNASVLIPVGPRVFIVDMTSQGLYADLFTGGLLESQVRTANIIFQPLPQLVGVRLRRAYIRGSDLRETDVRFRLSRHAPERGVSDITTTGEYPVLEVRGEAWSDALQVFELGYLYQGEVISLRVLPRGLWRIDEIYLDVDVEGFAPTRPEPFDFRVS